MSELIVVAAIAGAFGVHGEVKVKSFTAEPEAFLGYGPLLGADGQVVLTPDSARPVKKAFAVTAPEVATREQAEALKTTLLHVRREDLPETDEDEFYFSDLVGCEVKSPAGQRIGKVVAVHEFGAGDMLEIKPKDGAAFYHPFTKASVPKVDIKAKRIIAEIVEAEVVAPQEGDTS